VQRLVVRCEALGGAVGLAAFGLTAWGLVTIPMMSIWASQGGHLSFVQHDYFYFWPPSQMAEFMLGVVVSAFVLRRERLALETTVAEAEPLLGGGPLAPSKMRGMAASLAGYSVQVALGDAALLLVAVIVVALPLPAEGHREPIGCNYNGGAEPLLNHLLSPLLALFLWSSCDASGCSASLGARLLSNALVVGPGAYSFEVYVFHWPFLADPSHFIFEAPGGRLQFILLLWPACGLFAELVELPLIRWLRKVCASPSESGRHSKGMVPP